MNNQRTQAWFLPPTWLRFLVIILLILGIFFRFANLDHKVYQHDEAFTSMRISGYSKPEVKQKLFDGRVVTVADVQKYQHPTSEKSVVNTVQVLTQYAEHPPLYYLMARFWAQTFGSSVAVIRSLSALISLLTFPCVYWLCLELFQSSLTGWVAIALIAVSPLHVLYAQEARQYSLGTVMTLFASAALLRALRHNTKLTWGLYGIALALGLYSNLLFGLVIIAHGVYVVGSRKERDGESELAYLWTTALACLAFTPWLIAIVTNLQRINRFTGTGNRDVLALAKWWFRNLNNIFFDFYPSLEPFDPLRFDDPFLIPIVLILVGYALYFLYQQMPKNVWLFVFSLILLPILPLALMDLLQGGARSTAVRYLIPSYLGIQLAIAFLLAAHIKGVTGCNSKLLSRSVRQQWLWQLVMVVLLSGGILSCGISLSAEAWWNKFVDYYNPQTARIINQSSQPLVVSDTVIPGSVLSLSHLLDPKVRLQLVNTPEDLKIASGFQDVFLFDASEGLRRKLETEEGYTFEVVFQGYKYELWKSVHPQNQ
jgi:uncharacterized membrane protein